jgi:uncharacterized protein
MFAGCIVLRKNAWLDSLLSQPVDHDDRVTQTAIEVLDQLFVETQRRLYSSDFEFELLLPDDEASLEERIEALSSWCQGFVSGLNLIGINLDTLSGEAPQEALRDMLKMSCLAYDQEESGNAEDEAAYIELLEYARAAVMLLYEEIQRHKQGAQVSTELH